MAIVTPTINRIIRINEYDLLHTRVQQYNMYMCMDSKKLYYDENNNRRIPYAYQGVKTINDLTNKITPSLGVVYYCWEDNSLWLWNNKWIVLWTDNTYPSAYMYDDFDNISPVYSTDNPSAPVDNNGMLRDGSIIVRDRQRIIKGKLYIDDAEDNLIISSYLGGGIRLLPNGLMDSNGEVFIGDEGLSFIRSQLHIVDNEEYIDYSTNPDLDDNPYQNSSHIYKVFHEGNLDTSLIREITAEEIYNKLVAGKSELPNPFNFNVAQLDGLGKDDFARTQHTHISDEITDFNTAARAQAKYEIRQTLNNITTEGIDISYNSTLDNYNLSANSFNLTFTGGATGNNRVSHLQDTTINLVVDGTKHSHQNYIDRMNDLQNQINNLDIMDRDDYYTKMQTDALIEDIKGTATPTPNKPLLVNSDNNLPGNAISASKLDSVKHIVLNGDITGTVDTDFSTQDIIINTSASNILSSTPVAGKALAVNNNGDLPGNALSASGLNHTISVNVTNEATGTAILDTTQNSFSIALTLNPGNNIVQSTDLGNTVATLDAQHKLTYSQIPDTLLETTLKPVGTFNPNNGVPSNTPSNGQFWTAENNGTIDGKEIDADDWYLYLNNKWNVINTSENVLSVNGKKGTVVLTYDDVGGISSDLIDYTLGDTIPEGKIVRTDSAGVITGASVSNLTNPFSLLTSSLGDVIVGANSVAPSTDGATDLNIELELTQNALDKIWDAQGITIQNNGSPFAHTPNLNFSTDFVVTNTSNPDRTNVSMSNSIAPYKYIYIGDIQGNDPVTLNEDILRQITDFYESRADKPIMLWGRRVRTQNDIDIFIQFVIDGSDPDITSNTTTYLYSNVYLDRLAETDSTTGETSSKAYKYKISLTWNYVQGVQTSIVAGVLELDNIQGGFYLTTDTVSGQVTPFTPTEPYHPVTKQYVDNKELHKYTTTIGDGTQTEFTITHNLNTQNLLVQFRETSSKEQVYIANEIINNNSIKVTTNSVLTNGEVTVYILGL